MIDLHVHSAYSDGELTPEELVDRAVSVGMDVLALTDHDTTAGVPRFLAACTQAGVEGIAGVELSAECQQGTMHILGYFINPDEMAFQRLLGRIRAGREERNDRILRQLSSLGIALSIEQVKAFAHDGVVGRPHIAKALIEAGHARSWEDVFSRYLAKGRPAYSERYRLAPDACVKAIRSAEGVAVLAHPLSMGLKEPELTNCVKELAAAGLDGIEAYHVEHSRSDVKRFVKLAHAHGLITTGGSDFHGIRTHNGVALGRFGSVHVPRQCYDALCGCMQRRSSVA